MGRDLKVQNLAYAISLWNSNGFQWIPLPLQRYRGVHFCKGSLRFVNFLCISTPSGAAFAEAWGQLLTVIFALRLRYEQNELR